MCRRICLNSYEERIGQKKGVCKEILKQLRAESRNKGKRQRVDSSSKDEDTSVDSKTITATKSSEKTSGGGVNGHVLSDNDHEEETDEANNYVGEFKVKEEAVARVRSGWTSEECDSLVVGDLYVMVIFYTCVLSIPLNL